jgi:BlaI family penicillinase repressor
MNNTHRPRNLGEVEQLVMDYVWNSGPCTAEACREALASERPMKESTARTVLRRLEAKGYVSHTLEGRTFIYRAAQDRENVAVRAVKHIIDRFCNGSAEQLLIGMVDHDMVGRKDLERLARKISQSDAARKSSAKPPARPARKDEKP